MSGEAAKERTTPVYARRISIAPPLRATKYPKFFLNSRASLHEL